MSNEKLKVKDLEPLEQQELCKKMQEAGCKGNLTNYSVKSAQEKIQEYEKQKKSTSEDDTSKDVKEQISTSEEQSSNKTNEETFKIDEIKESNEVEKTTEQEETTAKIRNGICHICRSEVIDNVCTGCGFSMR